MRVRGEPVALRDFELRDSGRPAVPAADVLKASYHREFIDDLDRCEYFVPVEEVATVGLDAAIHEVGMFGNQNSVCAPSPLSGGIPSIG